MTSQVSRSVFRFATSANVKKGPLSVGFDSGPLPPRSSAMPAQARRRPPCRKGTLGSYSASHTRSLAGRARRRIGAGLRVSARAGKQQKKGADTESSGTPPIMATTSEMAEVRVKMLEKVVNRWALLFYAHQALQAFRAGSKEDFRQLRDVMNAVLTRPLALEQSIRCQLRIIQLLSRIQEDWTVDADTEKTPLESALVLLEKMKNEMDIDLNVIEKIKASIKEAAVIACLKNEEYDRANRIMKKYISKDPSIQKTMALLQTLIWEKNSCHPAVWNFSYRALQQNVLLDFESYLDSTEPYLLEIAKKSVADNTKTRPRSAEATSTEAVGNAPETSTAAAAIDLTSVGRTNGASTQPKSKVQDRNAAEGQTLESSVVGSKIVARPWQKAEANKAGAVLRAVSAERSGTLVHLALTPSNSDRCPSKRPASYGFSTLREAFKILSDSAAPEEVFSKLDSTDWTCPDPQRSKHQWEEMREEPEEEEEAETEEVEQEEEEEEEEERQSGSPSLLQNRVSISKLIMGVNGKVHWNPPNTSSMSSKKPETQAEKNQASVIPSQVRFSKKRANSVSSSTEMAVVQEEKEVWSEEDDLFQNLDPQNKTGRCKAGYKKKMWTWEESKWVSDGVRKFGEGNWKIICKAYPFNKRTPVMIKDRWRTMKKLGMR
uniref:Telomeric repeat binding factor 2 n=1 Tax=Salvator merianae TaxID=96440 RepID=A0A8D0BJI0_SALMN